MKTIPIFDFVLCLSEAVDMISPLVADHHKRTAQICYSLGKQLHLPEPDLRTLVIAAALHDVGGLTKGDRLSALDFEYQDPYGHSVLGYLLLKPFLPFAEVANVIRFHHVAWDNGKGATFDGIKVPMLSHLLQLADRIAILIDVNRDVLLQANNIVEKINVQSGTRFVPEHLEALLALRDKEYFWLDSVYMKDLNYLGRRIDFQEISLTEDDFLGLTNVFRRIIDFRSPFTATHSAGVAATAEALAMKLGFSGEDQKLITLAGLLHDLGKLAVPTEILEKPGLLTEEEFDLVKRHTYYTFHLLEPLKIMDIIRQWGALHHERLDGKGYPFHINEDELSLGSRVVAVADIFTALTENRPYRAGMDGAQAFKIITEMVGRGNLDTRVVSALEKNLALIDNERKMAQKSAVDEYQRFKELAILLTK